MKPDAEVRLDGIIKQAVPLILFSYDIHRKLLIEKLNHLYSSFVADDSNIFEELFIQIIDMINNREILDSNRERLIESFSNRTVTYDERLKQYGSTIRLLQKKLKQIERNQKAIANIRLDLKQLKKKKTDDKIITTKISEKSIGGKESLAPKIISNKSVDITEKICPKCNYSWEFKGKGYRIKDHIRIQCPKCKQFFNEKVIE